LDVNKRFSEEQIIGFLREAEHGVAVKDLCRRHGFSDASFYLWRSKFGGMDVSDAKRLKVLERQGRQLKALQGLRRRPRRHWIPLAMRCVLGRVLTETVGYDRSSLCALRPAFSRPCRYCP
jgi:putative transposase